MALQNIQHFWDTRFNHPTDDLIYQCIFKLFLLKFVLLTSISFYESRNANMSNCIMSFFYSNLQVVNLFQHLSIQFCRISIGFVSPPNSLHMIVKFKIVFVQPISNNVYSNLTPQILVHASRWIWINVWNWLHKDEINLYNMKQVFRYKTNLTEMWQNWTNKA